MVALSQLISLKRCSLICIKTEILLLYLSQRSYKVAMLSSSNLEMLLGKLSRKRNKTDRVLAEKVVEAELQTNKRNWTKKS